MFVTKFIKEHANWQELLIEKPYCLKIRETDSYWCLSYNQIESDFKEVIVRECRGLILRKSDLKVVCYPFTKFFNYGEGLAANIDMSSAKIMEKVDGSIIKVWWDDIWHISTNNMIDAFEAKQATGISYGSIFTTVYKNRYGDFTGFTKTLNKNYTYMFELVGPLTKVVVTYPEDLYHIGTRDNTTGQELEVDLCIKKPKYFNLNVGLDGLVELARELPACEEGYVVVDKDYNRVKIKGPAYVAMAHLKGNGVVSAKRLLHLIMVNETDEVLSYFPEFKPYIDKLEKLYKGYIAKVEQDIARIKDLTFETRKDFAIEVVKTQTPAFFFNVADGKYTYADLNKYLTDLGAEKLCKYLKIGDFTY